MNKKYLVSMCFCICFFFSSGNSQSIINIGIGPTWPKNLRETEKPTAWNASIEYGKVFDNIVGFAVDFDFSWNVNVKDTSYEVDSITVYKNNHEKKQFMFPISGCLFFDPIPKFALHPIIKGQVGLNMMVKSEKGYDSTGNEFKKPDSGFYIGIIGKASIDLLYDIGEHIALFSGFEFQWGRVRKKIKGSANEYYRQPFHGPAIRMGLSILY